MQLLQLAVN